ncbi:hypothetical protein A3K63_02120 [Candidatus Micrarchaeota archaeon RBG_16_49_10]|nr:MAG: hypothetical protein A3K63_02120 [Candidatus Micrarchaeota archaeon RBG_16_49_10]
MRVGVDLVKVCKALNCETKLRIVDLIFRKGSKSITDVRNGLNLSFSTTHKYLNQLEEANILSSNEVTENNRKKKIYRLNGFFLELNPGKISEIVKKEYITKREDRLKYHVTDILGR